MRVLVSNTPVQKPLLADIALHSFINGSLFLTTGIQVEHGTMWPGTGYFVPGVRCTTMAKYKREQAFSYECSMRFLFASQIVIETSIIGNDEIGHMVRGTLARGQAWPVGHKFTIGFLHKKING